MASSSVSQDDVEVDYEISSRRTRIRTARARNFNPSASRTGDADECDVEHDPGFVPGMALGGLGGGLYCLLPGTQSAEHDVSPKPANRVKEKRVIRAANVNKGKQQQRDRRKLREKRRSTGVVHMPSTESTGGSTGEDEELLSITSDSKRNPISNFGLDGAPVHHSPGYKQPELTKHKKLHSHPRNKSPSDLEADDEDNQEYESLTMSDLALSQGPALRAVTAGFSAKVPSMVTSAGHHHQHRPLPHTSSKYDLLKHSQPMPPAALVRGATYCSGVCTRGGQVLYGTVAGLQLTANRPSNGRPATPSSESSEEVRLGYGH